MTPWSPVHSKPHPRMVVYYARRQAWRAAGRDPARFRALMLGWIAAGKPPAYEWPDRDTTLTGVNGR